MKAMIFAAGLGSRLRPLTDTMPKALIPVAGTPMLAHVINKLKAAGFTEIMINIHHLGQQIVDYLEANHNFGITIHISDETDELLDTGGGIKKVADFFSSHEPVLVHNVDILSNTDLNALYQYHLASGNDSTLLVSHRKTARYLVFNKGHRLCGWINKETLQTKPEGFVYQPSLHEDYAFSGIHVISPSLIKYMDKQWTGKFSITDFYLQTCRQAHIGAMISNDLQLIDIGKPETLKKAEEFLSNLSNKSTQSTKG